MVTAFPEQTVERQGSMIFCIRKALKQPTQWVRGEDYYGFAGRGDDLSSEAERE